jgi:apolipoprotein N-acyltransferase
MDESHRKPAFSMPSVCLLFVSAGLLVLSHSPYDFGHLATIALVPWLWVTMRGTALNALLIGGGFGVGHAILGSFWIFDALGEQGFHGAWQVIAAIAVAFWAKGSIFAATGWVVWAVSPFRGKIPSIALAVPSIAFGLIEFWMSHSAWGLPLLLLGHSQSRVPGIRQLAVAIGVPGISTFLFALNLSIATTIAGGSRHRVQVLAVGLSWLVVLAVGHPIAEMFAAEDPKTSQRTLFVVQPYILPRDRWERTRQRDILDAIVEETSRSIAETPIRPDVILWPESLLTSAFSPQDPLGRRLQDQINVWGVPVVLGLVRAAAGIPSDASRLYRNSVVWWSPFVGPVDWQDKVRAIPIVESSHRFWGQGLLGSMTQAGSQAPRVAEAIQAGPLRGEFVLSPALCFEILFPGIVSDRRDEHSVAIINLADDSWVKGEVVDEQIIASATFRAIEQRLVMIRVSNGGLSVVIDRFGNRTAELPANEFGHLVVKARASRGPSLVEKLALLSPPFVAYFAMLMFWLRK